jgi:hypothetical protein
MISNVNWRNIPISLIDPRLRGVLSVNAC